MNLALIAAALTGVQVGAAIVASRFVVAQVPPLTLAMLRYAIGFLCLLPFVAAPWVAAMRRREAPFACSDILPIALLGMGQFAILIALLNFALQHMGAAQVALIFSLFPLLTLLLSAALGAERMTGSLLAGVLLSILGVAVSLLPKLGGAHAGGWWGELAVLAAACVGATCSVLYRPYLRRYPALPVSAFAMLASVALLAVLALHEHWPEHVTHLSPQAWGVVDFIGLSSGAGYFLWLYALKHESPTRVTVFLALNPVTASLLGALVLGEALDTWKVAAICLIAAGLWLAARTPRTAARG
ncbi:DMT family transporter [soil metagenome]